MKDRLRNFGFLVKDVGRLYTRRFEDHARELGLTLAQCKTLVNVAKCEGASQKALCKLADIQPMAMVRILDHMEADGWIVRRVDPADHRVRRLHTTARAKPVLDEIWRLADRTRTEFLRDLSHPERRALIDAMERIRSAALSLKPVLPATARVRGVRPEAVPNRGSEGSAPEPERSGAQAFRGR